MTAKLRTLAALLLMGFAFGLAACEQEGPLERAGSDADQTMEDIGEEIDEANEEINDEIDDATRDVNP